VVPECNIAGRRFGTTPALRATPPDSAGVFCIPSVYICEPMEARLTIFIGFVAFTMIFNTLFLWFTFKAFSNLAAKVTDGLHEFQTSSSTRQWLTKAHSASAEAARVTGAVRDQVVGFGPTLERIQGAHAKSLSKADVRFKLVCRAVHFTAEKMESVVTWPTKKIHIVSDIFEGLVAFIRGSESGSNASSRRTR
jgi:hypothetical protein